MNRYANSPLVLVHGFPLNSRMWDAVTGSLSNCFELHVLDLPGFGSKTASVERSLAAWAKDIRQQLLERSVTKPIQLCGLSMGGYVAMEFAALYPNLLSRLILCDTKTQADTSDAKMHRLTIAENLQSEDAEKRNTAIRNLANEMPKKLLAPKNQRADSPVVKAITEMIDEISPSALAHAQLAMAARRDTTNVITSLTCPVLGIVGGEDQLTPPSLMQALISDCKQGTIQIIAGAGHLPPMEAPPEFVDAITNGEPKA